MDPALQANDASTHVARIDGRNYAWRIEGGLLKAFNAEGDQLDPSSADVLMTLGGEEPEWLTTVEALQEACRSAKGNSPESVQEAAEALGLDATRRAEVARTTTKPPVLAALATVGVTQVGANFQCTPRAWELLLQSRSPSVRRQAYQSNEVLSPYLWDYPDANTRIRVARNPECPPEILNALANHNPDSPPVRAAVGSNVKTPDRALRALSADPDMSVRRCVAANPNCPLSSFAALAKDRFAPVRVSLLSNPEMPGSLVRRRIWIDPTPAVHVALGSRTDLPTRSLSWLERYSRSDPIIQYRQVCRRIADHPNRSEKIQNRVHRILARLDALSSDQIEQLDKARRGGRGQKLPPGVLPSLLIFAAALAIGGGLVGGGIQQIRLFSTQQGIAMIAVGAVVAIGLFILGLALYRRSPAYGLVRPPHPLALRVPGILLVILAVGALAAASGATTYLQPVVIIVVGLGIGQFFRGPMRFIRLPTRIWRGSKGS
jgi:hypothetical protein